VRRVALSAGAALALGGGLAHTIVTELLPPSPGPVAVKSQASLVRTPSGRWVVKDLWTPPGPTVNIAYGYRRGCDAGPPLARSWVEEEALWIRAWAPSSAAAALPGEEPADAELEAVLSALAPEILSDPRVGAVGVGPGRHESARVHWRGVAAWWAGALVWAGLPLACAGAGLELAANRRSPLVATGVCPRCRYGVRGLDVDRCPECGERFTTYEQTIIAALIRTPPATRA
jgi:hypothetical protein